MEFDAVLIPARRASSIAQGLWHDRTINDDLDDCVASCPEKIALTAVQAESEKVTHFTYSELSNMADRVALGLSKLGVTRNDVVACQLPNWWQFTVTYLACSRIVKPHVMLHFGVYLEGKIAHQQFGPLFDQRHDWRSRHRGIRRNQQVDLVDIKQFRVNTWGICRVALIVIGRELDLAT